MNSIERLTCVFEHKIPDRIPTFEWIIDPKVRNALMPGASDPEFCIGMGIDAICVDLNYSFERLQNGKIRDEWGMIKEYTEESHSFPVDGPLRDMDDLENYSPPDPHAPERFKTLEKTMADYGDKLAVILHLNDIFSIPSRLMPFEEFLINCAAEPEFIRAVVKMAVDVNIELAKEAARRGVKFVYTGDDFAYNTGPVVSPKVFEELFFPDMQRVFKAYKDCGFHIIKHSDGNLMPLMHLLEHAGFDCLDPIDPIAGMDLAHMKKTYGDKLLLKGNVNCATTLSFGSVEETIEESRRCIEIGKPGGNYIYSSSNSIHSSVRPENYKAMLETLDKYGWY